MSEGSKYKSPPDWRTILSCPPRFLECLPDWSTLSSRPKSEICALWDRHKTNFATEWASTDLGHLETASVSTQTKSWKIAPPPPPTRIPRRSWMTSSPGPTQWRGLDVQPRQVQARQEGGGVCGVPYQCEWEQALAKYTAAIRDYPTLRNISEVRWWYGLVNQVTYCLCKTEIISPFRLLLSPNTAFEWTDELEDAFAASKRR